MGGKGGSVTTGYRYHVAYHAGLAAGPIDAFLEFRVADQTAWAGRLEQSGTIHINKPELMGGDGDQGGIVSDVDLMFGEADQERNPYLMVFSQYVRRAAPPHLSFDQIFMLMAGHGWQFLQPTFDDDDAVASKIPAWRGLATLVFRGGQYGSNNPYPQKPAYKIEAIKQHWDEGCWYPETARIPCLAAVDLQSVAWRYQLVGHDDTADYSDPDYDDSAWPTARQPFGSFHDPESGIWDNVAAHGFPIQGTETGQNVKLWMRADVYVGQSAQNLEYEAYQDNQMAMWINGHLVCDQTLRYGGYVSGTIDSQYLVAGRNSVVIMARDNESTPSSGNWFYIAARITGSVEAYAMNPAHILYFARTNQVMGRTPIEEIDDASFRAGADWFHAQNFGLCTDWDASQESAEEFMVRIGKVAGCSVSRSVTDGKYHLDVANGIYDLDALPILTDDDILEFHEQPRTFDNATNSLSVEYFDPTQKEVITTAPLEAMALVNQFGVIHQATQYHEIPTGTLALRVADRDLRNYVTPVRTFDLVCARKPYDWRPNTYFRLQSAKRGIADMVCIFAEKSSGTLKSGAIKVTASQDIYGLPIASFIQAEPGVDTQTPAGSAMAVTAVAFELPYVMLVPQLTSDQLGSLAVDAGYLGVVAANPGTAGSYTLMTSPDGATYIDAATGNWCARGTIVESDDLANAPKTSFTFGAAIGATDVSVGAIGLWDSEIVRVDAIDLDAGTITLGRGCADTIPTAHAAGGTLWFVAHGTVSDQQQYIDGETEYARVVPMGASAGATTMTVTFDSRQSRPYPPANMMVAGNARPTSVSGSFAVTWAHRDRIGQADQLVAYDASSTTLPDNQRYGLRCEIAGAWSYTTAQGTPPTNTPPATPADGDTYIIGDAPTGAWAGQAEYTIATWNDGASAWIYTTPRGVDVDTPPLDAADGDRCLIGTAPTGAWAGQAKYTIALWTADGTLLAARTDIGAATATVELTHTGYIDLTLWTIDPSGESLVKHRVRFDYTPPASPTDSITATAYTPVYDGIIYDGGDAGTGTGS